MAVLCPVVSTDCSPGGPSELLEQGRWGWLVPVGDVDAMGDAIVATLNETPNRTELTKRGLDIDLSNLVRNTKSCITK